MAHGQSYPSRPVRWIVPFPAGGTTDLVARLLAQWLSTRLGQQFIVENKPGGGTNVGVQAAVNAPADGYTLLFTLTTNVINPWLYKSLPFDFQRDIVPVAGLAELPLVVDLNPAVPAKTLGELIAYAKANPGKINFASFGARTISDLAIQLLEMSAGIDVVRVPYQGGAPMLTDLMSGRVEAGLDALPNSLPHIRAGAVRGLAILSAKRTPALPDVPTAAELATSDDDRQMLLFYALKFNMARPLATPPDVPPERLAALQAAFDASMSDPQFLAEAGHLGFDIDPLSGTKIAEYMQTIASAPQPMVDRLRKLIGP